MPPKSNASDTDKAPPNLWKEAYSALSEDDKGKERLHRLHIILKEQLNKPKLKLRSEDGYKQLQAFIDKRSKDLAASKTSEKIGKITDNMMTIQELVAAGANVGGPYVAIPAAALFLAFSVHQIYKSERESMFELAENVAHYTVLHASSSARIKKLPTDSAQVRDLKRNLHMVYIGLYKALLLASTQLAISLYSDFQFIKNLMKHYDWEGQINDLEKHHRLCKDHRDELLARLHDPPIKSGPGKSMGPGPRNPLRASEQVVYWVQKNEYPINALTTRSYTAVHLAAEQGNTKIMKTLLTASGVDTRIKNIDGRTCLHIAALHNRVGCLKILLQRDRSLLGRRDGREKTAFLLAAQKGHIKILQALKELGQNFDETTIDSKYSALHLAVDRGSQPETVQFLLANGTKKGMKTKNGETAKAIAERQQKPEIAALL